MAGLSARQRLFVEEYLSCWCGAEAARRAGYSPRRADSKAYTLLHLPAIQAEVRRRLDERRASADLVLDRLSAQARNEASAYINDDGTVDLARLQAEGRGHLVKGIKYDRQGRMMVEFYDAQVALTLLGRHHRLFVDQVQLSGEVDVEIHDYREELERRLSGLVATNDEAGVSAEPE